ncbi:Protein FAF-like, chloroplastic, partial [Cucurbita argyrosperma subsp. argyrosperma]
MKTLFHDYKTLQKQGILTALPSSDLQFPTLPPPSLRRTLSADMSSSKCFSAIKKVASSLAFSLPPYSSSSSSSSSSEDEQDCDETIGFWGSVHEEQRKNRTECQKQGNNDDDDDSWKSILFQNSAPKSSVVPYVHPLLQKSAHSLSENSLLICTESLGSETGSDGFSSYPSSEFGDFDGDTTETEYPDIQTFQWKPIKFGRKKSPPRSFPPPISSLCSPDGASVCIQSRRENGRLILDAVSVPSKKNFRADRRDGRLVLSFVTTPANLLVKEWKIVEERDDLEADESEIPMDEVARLSSSVMNFHRLAMMMKKPNGFINRNPAWPKEKDAPEPLTPLSQSLPPRPRSLTAATAATSLNAYEYYWRSKPTGIQNLKSQQQIQPIQSITRKFISSNNQMADEKQQILNYLVPLSNGCKVPRRSVLLREPCCIATT